MISFDTTQTTQKTTRQAILPLLLLFVFVATVTFLSSRCLETIVGYTHRHTDWWVGFMKCTGEMDSGAITYSVWRMMYIRSFINIGSGIQKFIGEDTQKHRHIDTQRVWHKPIFIFSLFLLFLDRIYCFRSHIFIQQLSVKIRSRFIFWRYPNRICWSSGCPVSVVSVSPSK
jgi:hypothetical protein